MPPHVSAVSPGCDAFKTGSRQRAGGARLEWMPHTCEPLLFPAGDLLGGGAASQPPAYHTGGLPDELTGPPSASAVPFTHSNGFTDSGAGRPAGQGAADMFGGLSLGGKTTDAAALPRSGKPVAACKGTAARTTSPCALAFTTQSVRHSSDLPIRMRDRMQERLSMGTPHTVHA